MWCTKGASGRKIQPRRTVILGLVAYLLRGLCEKCNDKLSLRVAIIGAGQVADKVHASYYAPATIWNWWLSVTAAFPRRSAGRKIRECIRVGRSAGHAAAVKPDVVSVCSPNRFHYEHT